MNEHRESDSPVVPAKPPNKPDVSGAEVVEERGLPEGNTASQTRPRTPSRARCAECVGSCAAGQH
jgi:hypothetical protein